MTDKEARETQEAFMEDVVFEWDREESGLYRGLKAAVTGASCEIDSR